MDHPPNMCGDGRQTKAWEKLTLILELGGSGELLIAAGRRVGGRGKGEGGRGGDGQRGNECELHFFWILLLDRGLRILQQEFLLKL